MSDVVEDQSTETKKTINKIQVEKLIQKHIHLIIKALTKIYAFYKFLDNLETVVLILMTKY